MIIKKEKQGNVTIYTVDKNMTDEQADNLQDKRVTPGMIDYIIEHNADVYTADGKLLLRFRKNILPQKHIDDFYTNIISFARRTSSNRGSTSGSKIKDLAHNPKIMTNIFGYFDRWSPSQKVIFKHLHMKTPLEVRECNFNAENPEKYAKVVPLIQDIDKLYKMSTPDHYKKQRAKANQTFFRIPNTAFTTVTTNINFQTHIHKDKGDDSDGFGNLAVIEKGKYEGGETCFPQYGLGVNVRTGDILFMDVHQWHANLPIKMEGPDTVRLSIVCYLRYNVWNRTKHRPKSFYIRHNKTIKNIKGKSGKSGK